ncbi:putative nucleotidyltransferase, ribonuclease H [Tanacetum coccineum]
MSDGVNTRTMLKLACALRGSNPPPVTIHTWLERFNKQKPRSFEKAVAPVDAENWISHMEKIFDVMDCNDAFMTRLAVYKFEGDALAWWKGLISKPKGGDAWVLTLTWAAFKELVLSSVFPSSRARALEEGFLGQFTDVAQVADAARNLEILRDRDDYDRSETLDKSRDTQQNNYRSLDQKNMTCSKIMSSDHIINISVSQQSIGTTSRVILTLLHHMWTLTPVECRRTARIFVSMRPGGHLQRDCKKNIGASSSGHADRSRRISACLCTYQEQACQYFMVPSLVHLFLFGVQVMVDSGSHSFSRRNLLWIREEGFSRLALPLTKLMRKGEKFVSNEERENSFDELKQRLVSAPILTLPSGTGGFQIYSDASKKGLGCFVLMLIVVFALNIGDTTFMASRSDIFTVIRALNISSTVKIEHQRASGLLQPLEIPVWKWDEISMDFVCGLLYSCFGCVCFSLLCYHGSEEAHVSGLIVASHSTKSAHFLPIRKDYPVSKLAEMFQQEIVRLHGTPSAIVSDRDPRFTSRFWKGLQKAWGTRLKMVREQLGWDYICLCGVCLITVGMRALMRSLRDVDMVASPGKAEGSLNSSEPFATDMLEVRVPARGEHVSLKSITLQVGVQAFWYQGQAYSRFTGPFEILIAFGEVSYRLALPPQLSHVHNVFHVSLLRGYKYHPFHVVSYPFDQIREDLSYTEEPESILDRQEELRIKTILLSKSLEEGESSEREATWETRSLY